MSQVERAGRGAWGEAGGGVGMDQYLVVSHPVADARLLEARRFAIVRSGSLHLIFSGYATRCKLAKGNNCSSKNDYQDPFVALSLTHEERCRARDVLRTAVGGAALLSYERTLREGELEEPLAWA